MNRLATVTTPADTFGADAGESPPRALNGRPKVQHRARSKDEPGNANEAELFRQLAAPFAAECIGFKPQSVSAGKALAVGYLDARAVMDRLDEVLGPNGWQDNYESLPGGEIKCTLTLRISGEWISKADVGSRSDQHDSGDQVKAAFSDALKRAAVKWGIGRYLYYLPKQWVGFDSARRCFTETPKLPGWALPAGAEVSAKLDGSNGSAVVAVPSPEPTPSTGSANTRRKPSDGRALFNWLKQEERALVEDHLCRPGELVEHVALSGAKAGHGTQIVRWGASAIQFGLDTGLKFIAQRKGEPNPTSDDSLPATTNNSY